MVRSITLGIALLFVPALSPAQSSALSPAQSSTGRITREAVILELPRGESRVMATVPPGIVLELLGLQGDWYWVPVPSTGATTTNGRKLITGWINRAAIEPLPGRVPLTPAATSPAGSAALPPSPVQPPASRRLASRQGIRPRATELSLQGAFSATKSGGGDTTSTLQLDSLVGYFVSPQVEIGLVTNVVKVTGVDAIGQIGGSAAYNVGTDQPVNGFVGGAVGRGFGLSPLNPTILEVFGGIRVMAPGGGGAFVVRPFWQHDLLSGGRTVNSYGVAFGMSIFF